MTVVATPVYKFLCENGDMKVFDGPLSTHLAVEAAEKAFGRGQLFLNGDPVFVRVPSSRPTNEGREGSSLRIINPQREYHAGK